eukprot:416979_1
MTDIAIESLDSHQFRFILYTSVIGAVVSLCINGILLTNVIRFYSKKLCHSNNKQSTQTRIKQQSYLLIIIYLLSNCVSSASYAFIRTNVITQIDRGQWTAGICATGYVLSYLSYYISIAMLYIIFIWRVKISFQGSVSEYNNCILYPFLAVIVIVIFALLIEIILLVTAAEWILLHGESSNISFCGNNAVDKIILSDIDAILSVIVAIFHIAMSIGLLYMFIRGLVLVNRILIKSFVTEHVHPDAINLNNIVQRQTEINKFDLKDISPDAISVKTVLAECTDATKTAVERKHLSREASKILVLHDLVKKQTILVATSIISSALLWILGAVNDWFILELYWDMSINAVCVWLMLASSNKYWDLCKKSCLRCFYVKENRI